MVLLDDVLSSLLRQCLKSVLHILHLWPQEYLELLYLRDLKMVCGMCLLELYRCGALTISLQNWSNYFPRSDTNSLSMFPVAFFGGTGGI